MIINYKKCIALCILFFSFPLSSFAEDVAISLFPTNPTPYTETTATLVSYAFNVNTAYIKWSINGKIVLEGIGEKKLKLKTGGSGVGIPVHVSINNNKEVTEINTTITPESVDIIYETPESYVPLFYEGRSLPGEGALVHFVALPNISEDGVIVSGKSLDYSWYVNDTLKEDISGFGKSSVILPLNFLTSYTRIKVIVQSQSGATAEKFIDIYPHEVMPLLYSYDDIFGVDYTRLLTKRFETIKDFTLALEPYYLSLNNLSDFVSFDWNLDNLSVTPLDGRLLAMHPKENSYGSKNLSISISNSKRRLQKADTSINLIFDTR
jgi:hypothetical protein